MVAMPSAMRSATMSFKQHLEAGQRADMGDAVAHLAGADHADGADGMRQSLAVLAARLRPVFHVDHLALPSS